MLVIGLALAIAFFIVMRRRIGPGTALPSGAFNIGCGLFAVAPAVLIKVGVIAQTTASVSLAFCYFLVFVIGAMLVDSRAIRLKHDQRGR